MKIKDYKIGNKYNSSELMALAVELMYNSIPEHIDRADPKVGVVLAKEDGTLIDIAFRGELRLGDHAEYTVLERKHRSDILNEHVIYATLEPCGPGARSITKLSCAERIVNARIKRVYIGIEDPDPKVRGNGKAYLENFNIKCEPFDAIFQEEISLANEQFLNEALERAKLADIEELQPVFSTLDESLENYKFEDFSVEALTKFKDNLKITYDLDSIEFKSVLKKWNLIRTDIKTNSIVATGLGILLFGKNPQIQFPQSLIKFTIKTKNEYQPKILDFDGPLVLIPEKIESYLEINFPKSINRSTFARTETKEIYFEVLREVIINAIVHRDYTIEGANINVKIDDEKIEIQSPGKPIVSLEKLKLFIAPTFSTNPKIANIFYQMKFIEKRNLGMQELLDFSKITGLKKPILEYNDPYLSVIIWRIIGLRNEPASENIIEFANINKLFSSGDYAEHYTVSTKTASRHLNKLVKDGVLGREGEKKGTKYFLKKKI